MLKHGDHIEQATVLDSYRKGRNVVYRFRCDCGEEFEKAARHIDPKWAVSCGCRYSLRSGNPGVGNSRHPLRGMWGMMLERCYNPENPSFERYGGRGITVCDRWRWGDGALSGLECFATDMGERPSPRHSVERLDNFHGYSSQNCTWATATEQSRNRRNVVRYTYGGKALTIPEWAEVLGMNVGSLRSRFMLGWTVERALGQPARKTPTRPGATNERCPQREPRRRHSGGLGDGHPDDRQVGGVGE